MRPSAIWSPLEMVAGPPPMPLSSAPDPFVRRLQAVAATTQQPNVPSIQRRAAVLQLHLVIDEHPSLSSTASRSLTAATCFPSNTIPQLEPFTRQVEAVSSSWRCLCRLQVGQTYAQLQQVQSVCHECFGCLSAASTSQSILLPRLFVYFEDVSHKRSSHLTCLLTPRACVQRGTGMTISAADIDGSASRR
jgi:hypothetical protein